MILGRRGTAAARARAAIALVGRGERDAHVLAPRQRRRSARERRGCPRVGEPATVSQHGSSRGRPQVEPGLGVVDPRSRHASRPRPAGSPGGPRYRAFCAATWASSREGGAVTPPGPARAPSCPACLRTSSSSPDQGGVAGDERGAVAGEVGLLRQRVHARAGPRASRRRPAGRGCSATLDRPLPRRVRRSTRRDATTAPSSPGPGDDLREVLDAEHPAGRVAGRVQPDKTHRRAAAAGRPGRCRRPATGRRPGEPGADVVRRVGEPRGGRRRRRARGRAASAARRRAPWSRSSAARRRGRGRARRGAGRTSRATASRRSACPYVSG